jgi:hypothetical protein
MLDLPDADPGHHVIHRWRKHFCSKSEDGTVLNECDALPAAW